MKAMPPRIAIPVPHSEREYADRSLPQYEYAVQMAGGEPVHIPLDLPPLETMKLIERCDAVLLPGSKADVDPEKYAAPRHPHTAAADSRRDAVDQLLLQDAYRTRKPILGICYGLQILNVHRTGTLVQHIESPVNHEAGRKVPIAHKAEVDPGSKLAKIVAAGAQGLVSEALDPGRLKPGASTDPPASAVIPASFSPHPATDSASSPGASSDGATVEGQGFSRAKTHAKNLGTLALQGHALIIPVNSSHHQAAEVAGDGLRVVARCPDDGVIEALEGTSPDHFVLAVQWHPERSVDDDQPSRAIFRALVEAARERHRKVTGKFESV
jgi:putative glutamine amidotransferase